MIRVSNIRVGLDGIENIPGHVARAVGVSEDRIVDWRFVKKSVDARHASKPTFVVSIDVSLQDENSWLDNTENLPPDISQINDISYHPPEPGNRTLSRKPVVIGAGPAGLFCALTLAQAGCAPILLERGDTVADRIGSVSRFWTDGVLDADSNVQFGEGGAGTFSDGKLTTRIRDPRCAHVLKTFVGAGAPENILWEHMPHIGTDRLRTVIPGITRRIKVAGGEVLFRQRMDRINLAADGRVTGVVTADGIVINTDTVVLATGHSARDTFQMLADTSIELTARPFAVGMRIEHPQSLIDSAQYGAFAGHPALPPATYRLAERISPDRSAWSFCMCPGGVVINASSEVGGVVTNGMSPLARDGCFANSAIVVNVGIDDFPVPGPLGGVELQRKMERAAFRMADSNAVETRNSIPTTAIVDIAGSTHYLPRPVLRTLVQALPRMGHKIRGFDNPDITMLGPETRTSSPVRITRDKNCVAVNTPGLYPCGEGAGYAGGIVSAAVDGIRVAEAVITNPG